MKRKISRKFFVLGTCVLLALALGYAFRPVPFEVDMGEAARRPMTATVDEEGRTRVRDAYTVFAPVDGRLLRVEVEPGDPVIAGKTVVGRMTPSVPTPLDARDETRARADLAAAEAALKLARADRDRAAADRDLAQVQLRRIRGLRSSGAASQLQLDQAEREARTTSAALHNAEAAIAVREAERKGALSRLGRFGEGGTKDAGANVLLIRAPADGRVLRVMRESEGPLSAGTPLMEIGDFGSGMEAVVELLSSEAVRVSSGDRVILSGWGGSPLNGIVDKVEPFAFTKVSALGVEEQRVNVVVRLTDPPEATDRLGHGFRVEARIVVWEDRDALTAPSSALFRVNGQWAVFVAEEGTARLRRVSIGQDNGTDAQILDGLRAGERVVLYPSSDLTDGSRVVSRGAR